MVCFDASGELMSHSHDSSLEFQHLQVSKPVLPQVDDDEITYVAQPVHIGEAFSFFHPQKRGGSVLQAPPKSHVKC